MLSSRAHRPQYPPKLRVLQLCAATRTLLGGTDLLRASRRFNQVPNLANDRRPKRVRGASPGPFRWPERDAGDQLLVARHDDLQGGCQPLPVMGGAAKKRQKMSLRFWGDDIADDRRNESGLRHLPPEQDEAVRPAKH